MAGKLYSAGWQVKAQLHRELQKLVEGTARGILVRSNHYITTHAGGKGLALGPGGREQDLVASGYVVTAKDNGYDDAVAEMFSTPGTRTERRGQQAPRVEVQQYNKGVSARVAYAAAHANLLHDGYDDAHGNYMVGTPFLKDAVDSLEGTFFNKVDLILEVLTLIEAPTPEVREGRQKDKTLRMMDASGRRGKREMWYEFRGSTPPEEFERKRFGVKGVTKRGKPIYSRENATERDERIMQMYHAWLEMRNSNYRGF